MRAYALLPANPAKHGLISSFLYPIRKGKGDLRSKLPELMSHHILRNRHIVVHLSIVDLELQADEVWEDGRGAGLCADRVYLHAWDDLGDWEPAEG